ncbi:MAG: rRNA adenine N-6-methyltransferase family protein, partial [Phycisphaerales bacterium]
MPQTLSEIRAELDARGIRPKHRFGQNFLHDHNQLRRLVSAAAVAPGELVLEVGPGTGTLTETLLDAGCEVVACELDPDMAEIVRARNRHRLCAGAGRVTVVEDDCLDGKHALSPA